VLKRIMGRTRNMMRLPGGGTAWPGFPLSALTQLTAIRQARMIQHSLDLIEVQLVLERPLAAAEEEVLRQAVRARLGHPFEILLSTIERIERGPGYKMEDFECRMI
jgi:phenylacetate-CoA ligase